jgi:hypothetical protein
MSDSDFSCNSAGSSDECTSSHEEPKVLSLRGKGTRATKPKSPKKKAAKKPTKAQGKKKADDWFPNPSDSVCTTCHNYKRDPAFLQVSKFLSNTSRKVLVVLLLYTDAILSISRTML